MVLTRLMGCFGRFYKRGRLLPLLFQHGISSLIPQYQLRNQYLFVMIMTPHMRDLLGVFSDHFGFDIGKFAYQSNFLGYPT